MADTQIIPVEFQVDYSQLDAAIDTLVKTGKVDAQVAAQFKQANAELAKKSQVLREVGKSGQAAAQDLVGLFQNLSKISTVAGQDFLAGMEEVLDSAGISMQEFLQMLTQYEGELGDADAETKKFIGRLTEYAGRLDNVDTQTKKSGQSHVTLRTQIQNLREEMARVAQVSGTTSAEYRKLEEQAGRLANISRQVAKDVSLEASETTNIDMISGSLNALVGGYTAVQGVAALFGSENEDLQAGLVKLNAAMSISIGVQQISQALTKDGILLKTADKVATGLQTAAMAVYTTVMGGATVATKVFGAALLTVMGATGLLLLVTLVTAAIKALEGMGRAFRQAEQDARLALSGVEAFNEGVERAIQKQIALQRAAGETNVAQMATQLRGNRTQIDNYTRSIEENIQKQKQLDTRTKSGTKAFGEYQKTINQLSKDKEKLSHDTEILAINIQGEALAENKRRIEQKKSEDERKAAEAKSGAGAGASLLKKRQEELIQQRTLELENIIAVEQTKLLLVQQGSVEELQVKREVLKSQLELELFNTRDSLEKQTLLRTQYYKDVADLEKDFSFKQHEQRVQDQKLQIETQLLSTTITNKRRLELNIEALKIMAEDEVLAAEGNQEKIKNVYARRDAAIRDLRKKFAEESVKIEEQTQEALDAPHRRRLQRAVEDEGELLEVRLDAVDQLETSELDAIDKKIRKNLEAGKVIGADQEALNLELAQLLDERDQIEQEHADERVNINAEANKKIKEEMIRTLEDINRIGSFVLSQFEGIASEIAATENQALSEAQAQLDEMIEAGTISEKEAQARQKRLDVQEKRVKAQQAKREHTLAIFRAILAIPEAFLEGLTTGGPILGAIYAALAAAQLAIIASRPPPKFAKGKKNLYEGPGIVGEQGYELIERAGGDMFLTKKPSLVYLGARDKVFTHKETTKILQPHVDKTIMNQVTNDGVNIDYDKLAKAILSTQEKQKGTVINIDKEFISESVASGLMKIKYFDRYYSSK